VIILLTSLFKIFFFLRIFPSLTYIVTMIVQVTKDLQIFLVFFITLVFMGSLIFNLIFIVDQPEYVKIGPFFGSFIYNLRMALGDFDFSMLGLDDDDPHQLSDSKEQLWWIMWMFMVVFALLIMLNFIIAEVSNSYEVVKENLEALIYKERAGLIAEAECIMPQSMRENNKVFFPKYIVAREADE